VGYSLVIFDDFKTLLSDEQISHERQTMERISAFQNYSFQATVTFFTSLRILMSSRSIFPREPLFNIFPVSYSAGCFPYHTGNFFPNTFAETRNAQEKVQDERTYLIKIADE